MISSSRVVEMISEKPLKPFNPPSKPSGSKLRVKQPKCPSYPKPEVKSEGFEFTNGKGVVRFDTRQLRNALKSDFELSFGVSQKSF